MYLLKKFIKLFFFFLIKLNKVNKNCYLVFLDFNINAQSEKGLPFAN